PAANVYLSDFDSAAGARWTNDTAHATQAEVACDRFLLAPDDFKPHTCLALLMKDLGSESVTPGLNHAPAFPMQGIGEQKTRGIGQVLLFMHDHQALAPIPLQPHYLGESKEHLLLAIAAAHLYLPSRGAVGATPHPLHPRAASDPASRMPRDFYFTDPMLTTAFNQTGQFQRQHPLIKSIMGLREPAFGFQLAYDLYRDLRPFAVL